MVIFYMVNTVSKGVEGQESFFIEDLIVEKERHLLPSVQSVAFCCLPDFVVVFFFDFFLFVCF